MGNRVSQSAEMVERATPRRRRHGRSKFTKRLPPITPTELKIYNGDIEAPNDAITMKEKFTTPYGEITAERFVDAFNSTEETRLRKTELNALYILVLLFRGVKVHRGEQIVTAKLRGITQILERYEFRLPRIARRTRAENADITVSPPRHRRFRLGATDDLVSPFGTVPHDLALAITRDPGSHTLTAAHLCCFMYLARDYDMLDVLEPTDTGVTTYVLDIRGFLEQTSVRTPTAEAKTIARTA